MLRLVTGFLDVALRSLSEISHTNLSSSIFHFIPRALCVGSCSNSKFTTVLALSASGMAARTLLSLLHHFVKWKPPLLSCLLTLSAKEMASATVSVDFMRSSTYMFLSITFATSEFCCSSIIAVFFKQKFTTLGDDVAPNMCFTIRYSTSSADKSPPGHHKNLNASQSFGSTLTWWNIDCMSAVRPTVSWRKRLNTPTIRLVKSGPCNNCLFKEVCANWAAQSNTTRTFSGFKGCITGWWGKYHSGRSTGRSSLVGTLSAWPCSMYSFIVVLYLENKSWSLRRRFLSSAARRSTIDRLFGK